MKKNKKLIRKQNGIQIKDRWYNLQFKLFIIIIIIIIIKQRMSVWCNAIEHKAIDKDLTHFNSEMLLLIHLTIIVNFIICRILYIF